MKQFLTTIFVCAFLLACSSNKTASSTSSNRSFTVTEVSKDETYGYTKENPIKVGGVKNSSGPANERKYLNFLTGPNGEMINYYRAGSCCAFKTKNGFLGAGLLDIYKVVWEGSQDTLTLYLNMYDRAKLKAPKGFGIKK